MDTGLLKKKILELCAEDVHGSWEFWSTAEGKTPEEADQITQAITQLVQEGQITPVKYVPENKSYAQVALDESLLAQEVRRSMEQGAVDPDTFYWFLVTRH